MKYQDVIEEKKQENEGWGITQFVKGHCDIIVSCCAPVIAALTSVCLGYWLSNRSEEQRRGQQNREIAIINIVNDSGQFYNNVEASIKQKDYSVVARRLSQIADGTKELFKQFEKNKRPILQTKLTALKLRQAIALCYSREYEEAKSVFSDLILNIQIQKQKQKLDSYLLMLNNEDAPKDNEVRFCVKDDVITMKIKGVDDFCISQNDPIYNMIKSKAASENKVFTPDDIKLLKQSILSKIEVKYDSGYEDKIYKWWGFLCLKLARQNRIENNNQEKEKANFQEAKNKLGSSLQKDKAQPLLDLINKYLDWYLSDDTEAKTKALLSFVNIFPQVFKLIGNNRKGEMLFVEDDLFDFYAQLCSKKPAINGQEKNIKRAIGAYVREIALTYYGSKDCFILNAPKRKKIREQITNLGGQLAKENNSKGNNKLSFFTPIDCDIKNNKFQFQKEIQFKKSDMCTGSKNYLPGDNTQSSYDYDEYNAKYIIGNIIESALKLQP